MMKVITKDFQILSGENTFEFPVGINMIVGSNASGKSSLFYAIEHCLTNPNGVSDCINYNTKETQVTIQDNEESVTWVRGSSYSKYINNKTNQEFIKASKLDSRDIADLNFYFDNKGRVLNIHSEWSILFPFGESDVDMFRIFEDIFNVSNSFKIIDEMKKDEQYLKSEITNNQKEKELIDQKLQNISEIQSKVNKNTIIDFIQKIQDMENYLSKLGEDYKLYSKIVLLVDSILPNVFDVSTLYDANINYKNLCNDYEAYLKLLQRTKIQIPEFNIKLDFEYPTQLKTDYEQYCINNTTIQQLESELQQTKQRINEIDNILSQYKCPMCGTIIGEKKCLTVN